VRIKLGSESVADLRERLKPSLHDGVIMNAATTCMTLSRECTVLWGKIRIIILDPTWSDYPLLSEKPFDRETNALKGHISSLLAKTELIAQDIR
jgi:DNA polymerase III epsilon subunit-like protein